MKRKLIIKEAVEKIKNQVNNIESIENTTKIKDIRSSIQGYEGTASRVYFKMLSELMPEKYKFNGRSKIQQKMNLTVC